MKDRIIEISANNHAEWIILPINPKTIQVSMGQANQTLTLLNLGEVLTLGNRQLNSLSISSFFPGRKSPYFYRYCDRDPQDYLDQLERWRMSKTVVRVIIGGTTVNMAAAIDKLTQEIREGDGDLYYTIDFKEYRRLNVPQVQHSSVQLQNGLGDRPDMEQRPAAHVVRSTDETLWYIACRYYGDGTMWKQIANLNRKELAYDVSVGDVITLP